MLRFGLGLSAAMLAGLACACAPGPQPCASVGTCPEGEECLANRCVPYGGEPVVSATRRVVLEPRAMAIVSANGDSGGHGLPATIALGSGVRGATAVYLRFAPTRLTASAIDSAFLLMEPAAATFPSSADVSVEVWRVRESWHPERLSWFDQPELAPPRARGIARGAPPLPLRVDVTDLVRHLAAHPENDRGLALKAPGGDGHGTSFASGAAGGRAPRLELYVREAKP